MSEFVIPLLSWILSQFDTAPVYVCANYLQHRSSHKQFVKMLIIFKSNTAFSHTSTIWFGRRRKKRLVYAKRLKNYHPTIAHIMNLNRTTTKTRWNWMKLTKWMDLFHPKHTITDDNFSIKLCSYAVSLLCYKVAHALAISLSF